MKLKLLVIVLAAFIFQACPPRYPQQLLQNRFENEIKAFEQQDKKNGIDKGRILFVGSSSIRMWKTLEADMKPLKVLNRGFGGATTNEVSFFFDRIVKPYKPKTIVIYVGENDIAESDAPDRVFESVKLLVNQIEQEFKTIEIVYLSMKPSIARWEMWDDFQKGNAMIEGWMATKGNCHYIEMADVMLNKDGSIKKDIFISDGLHLNTKGYEDWTNMVKPVLEKLKK